MDQIICSHFGSSGYFAQGDAQAVSDLAFTSPHLGHVSLSCALFFSCILPCVLHVLRNSSLSKHSSLLTSRIARHLMWKSQKMLLILHLMRARRPSRTQALPSLRVVLTLPCALLLLVSPALAMELWRPRYPDSEKYLGPSPSLEHEELFRDVITS